MTNAQYLLKVLQHLDIMSLSNLPPIFWVSLCENLQLHREPEVVGRFIDVANFLVQRGKWHQIVLKCLRSGNFHFIKQFFYLPYLPLPRYITEETLALLQIISTNVTLVKEWVDGGFANATLWDSIHSELWDSPPFGYLLSNPDIDSNLPDPHSGKVGRLGLPQIPHAFFNIPSVKGRDIPSSYSAFWSASSEDLTTRALQAYQSQLMLLERANCKILMNLENRTTPLIWAVAHGKLRLVDTILKSPRANVNAQDAYLRTPLMYAIAVVDLDIVKRLMACRDIDLNLRDNTGRTAIFYASRAGYLNITKLLIQATGIDLNIRDITGQTALNYAQACGYQDIVATLLPEA